jgi:hypothetical protein
VTALAVEHGPRHDLRRVVPDPTPDAPVGQQQREPAVAGENRGRTAASPRRRGVDGARRWADRGYPPGPRVAVVRRGPARFVPARFVPAAFVPRRAGRRGWCAVRAPGCVCRAGRIGHPSPVDNCGDERRAFALASRASADRSPPCRWSCSARVRCSVRACGQGGPRSRMAWSAPVRPVRSSDPDRDPDRDEQTDCRADRARSIRGGPGRRGGRWKRRPSPGG